VFHGASLLEGLTPQHSAAFAAGIESPSPRLITREPSELLSGGFHRATKLTVGHITITNHERKRLVAAHPGTTRYHGADAHASTLARLRSGGIEAGFRSFCARPLKPRPFTDAGSFHSGAVAKAASGADASFFGGQAELFLKALSLPRLFSLCRKHFPAQSKASYERRYTARRIVVRRKSTVSGFATVGRVRCREKKGFGTGRFCRFFSGDLPHRTVKMPFAPRCLKLARPWLAPPLRIRER